jgi:dihydroorotate dehydrogenase electron transfer subunit
MHQVIATVADTRTFGGLSYMTLHAPELARGVRPGQYLLVRCAPTGSADPLLGRALFVAGHDGQAGLVRLLFAPDEPGLAWLSMQASGNPISLVGPLGKPFALEKGTRHLLLIGEGQSLPALLMLAHEAASREVAVVLHAGAERSDLLPPPFLLPPAVEYESFEVVEERKGTRGQTNSTAVARDESPFVPPSASIASGPVTPSQIAWADQVAAALPLEKVAPLIEDIRKAKLRWERGFAHVALSGPLPCLTAACLSCLIDSHEGMRLRCKDGPVFDMRDLR